MQEEVQEGQEEEEALPEDLLRARLPRLNGRLEAQAARSCVRGEGWRRSHVDEVKRASQVAPLRADKL